MLMRQTKDGRVMSKQQDNREVGFLHYMHDHYPNVKVTDLDLPLNGTRAEYNKMLEKFFSSNPQVHHCITLTSKAHIVGDFLLKTNRRNIQIMGYDMVEKNARCLREEAYLSSSPSMPTCKAMRASILSSRPSC